MITVLGRNTMLDSFGSTYGYVAAHTAFPGRLGASNEVTGGSPAYARKAHTWNGASAAGLDDSNTPSLDIPAATTVQWISLWSLVTGGVCGSVMPAGGSTKRFTMVAATDVFTSVAHGLSDTNQIVFWGDTVPTGLTEGTIYFLRDATTDTFKVAATSGGTAIDVSGTPSVYCNFSLIVPESFGAQGVFQISDFDAFVDA